MKLTSLDTFNQIPSSDFRRISSSKSPLLASSFFNCLETSGCIGDGTGWWPNHLLLSDEVGLQGIIPAYIKSHSWGEFVFDWSWAEAYEQHGLEYYPKLVCTIPFTPISSDKLISTSLGHGDVLEKLTDHCLEQAIHSWHMLFCPRIEKLPINVFERHTVQFHWFNRDYTDFDDFLSYFTARKRKNTHKERQSITEQGIEVRHFSGHEIGEKELDFFFLCYQQPYLKRGHKPHLNKLFFALLVERFADNILLIVAMHRNRYVASALFIVDDKQLYGRYWGCVEEFDNLHFELCYYQGIEFCIENKMACFNPGAQGEHKIRRGFEPVITYSYHWVSNVAFRAAIKDFCYRERQHLQRYFNACQKALPFKKIG